MFSILIIIYYINCEKLLLNTFNGTKILLEHYKITNYKEDERNSLLTYNNYESYIDFDKISKFISFWYQQNPKLCKFISEDDLLCIFMALKSHPEFWIIEYSDNIIIEKYSFILLRILNLKNNYGVTSIIEPIKIIMNNNDNDYDCMAIAMALFAFFSVGLLYLMGF